jgi:hypothetical protein
MPSVLIELPVSVATTVTVRLIIESSDFDAPDSPT